MSANGTDSRARWSSTILLLTLATAPFAAVPSRAAAQCGETLVFSGTRVGGGECECFCTNRVQIGCDGVVPELSPCESGCFLSHSWTGNGPDPETCEYFCSNGALCSSSLPLPCGADGCNPSGEQCDGFDNDRDGQVDNGVCTPDGPCHNFRTDPVHVGSGAFVTEPQVDVRFAGSAVPIEFVRQYSSMTRRAEELLHRNGFGGGWSHTLGERLFSSDGRSAPPTPTTSTAALTYLHRDGAGQYRRFVCAAPHNPTTTFACVTSDGTLDELKWVPGASHNWQIATANALRTDFSATTGLLLRRTSLDLKQYWTVTYDALSRPTLVTDHLQRQMVVEWSGNDGELHRIVALRDGSGALLASYLHDTGRTHLTGVETAGVVEEYEYASIARGTGAVRLPYLERIRRGGLVVTEVTYDYDASAGTMGSGRVRAVAAPDGSFAFRYAGDPRNACADPSISTTVVDRSTAPIGSTCSDTASGDAYCTAANGGELAVCDAGTCRAATCQGFLRVSPTVVDFSQTTAIGGNCACSGAEAFAYGSATSEAPRRLLASRDRAGVITSYAHDARGRMVAECVNDTGTVDGSGGAQAQVSATDPSTCPLTGRYTRWTYGTVGVDAVHPRQLIREERRSALAATSFATTEYQYDLTSGAVTRIRRTGLTRELSDANVSETRDVVLGYGANGMINSVTDPRDGVATFEYYPAAGFGLSNGMLRYQRRAVGAATLTTSFSSYTSTGRPQTETAESGAVTVYTYDFSGLRLASLARNGQTTTMHYDVATGRLMRIVEPNGRHVVYDYDSRSRIESVTAHDSATTFAGDRTFYEYDDAGRRTRVRTQRVDSAGAVSATSSDWRATYDTYGNLATEQIGFRWPVTFTYDEAALGYLEQRQRGDGDLETFTQDSFGRDATFVRHFGGAVTGEFILGYAPSSGTELGGARPTSVIDPANRQRVYTYDDFGQLVRSESPEWGTVRWRYIGGRLYQTRWADGRITQFTYDQIGRVTAIDNDQANPIMVGQDYRFHYDNGDGAVSCPTGAPNACQFRKGHLARVEIERSPGVFWDMFYDYTAQGQVSLERWPGGYNAIYTYDAQGRRTHMQYPSSTTDRVRWTYDSTSGNAYDGTEVIAITGERSGSDYVNWARAIDRDASGRVTGVRTHEFAIGSPQTLTSWRTDGRLNCMSARRGGSATTTMVDRCYVYAIDGATLTHDSVVAADLARTYFVDGANRLTCATSTFNATSCPSSGATLLGQYAYSTSGSLQSIVTAAGSTSFTYNGNGSSLYDEYPPGRTIWYSYLNADLGGNRTSDVEVTSGAPPNDRDFIYDAQGRLRTLTLTRPTSTASTTRQPHTISIIYDHRSRPIYVTDLNQSTSVESRWQYYYDDRELVASTYTPDASAPLNYTREQYVAIFKTLMGTLRTQYTFGTGAESLYYTVLSPEGLPLTAWSFSRTTPYATNEVWRAQYSPYGETLSLTGTGTSLRPPHRFVGQLELPRSDASWWNGSTLYQSRAPIALNTWRAYDSRVGQYLQPEPVLIDGSGRAMPPYGYALLAPADFSDPDGLAPDEMGGAAPLPEDDAGDNACEMTRVPGAPRPPPRPTPPDPRPQCAYPECIGENCRTCCQWMGGGSRCVSECCGGYR